MAKERVVVLPYPERKMGAVYIKCLWRRLMGKRDTRKEEMTMMISPESYVDDHRNDSFEELIAERNQLVEELNRLEKIVYDKECADKAWSMHPGPDVQYQVTLQYLAQLCDFLQEKYRREIVWKEMEE
ncbi:MAG: hypothetical protein E7222_09900 [Clostridiales bacterium]|nr:hypothetical protein [Clostridiales bacterium]